MSVRWARGVIGIAIGLYLVGLGGLVGVAVERIRFDYRRDPVLARYDAVLRARQAIRMVIEREIAETVGAPRTDPAPVPFGVRAEVPGS